MLFSLIYFIWIFWLTHDVSGAKNFVIMREKRKWYFRYFISKKTIRCSLCLSLPLLPAKTLRTKGKFRHLEQYLFSEYKLVSLQWDKIMHHLIDLDLYSVLIASGSEYSLNSNNDTSAWKIQWWQVLEFETSFAFAHF